MSPWRSCCVVLALSAVLVAVPARAADDAGGAWLVVSTGDHFRAGGENSRWQYAFDAQYRWFDRAGGIEQTLLRPALGFDLTPTLSAWAGYAYVHSDRDPGVHIAEHRLWQQLAWQDKGILDTTWLLRGRLEERRRQNSSDIGYTLRLMVRGAHVLTAAEDVRFIAGIESFYNLGDSDWGLESGFTQLRAMIGLQFNLHRKLGLEAGYLNQSISRSRLPDQANHLLYLNFRLRF